jgi:hypothetical protein
MTCYYYRGAYYKAFWADPPGCAVGEPRKSYLGENSLPLIVQNAHRYFCTGAAVLVCLSYDSWRSFTSSAPMALEHFRARFGLARDHRVRGISRALHDQLSSFRHLIGGKNDTLTHQPIKMACYGCVSSLNKRHMNFAWISLFGVMSADLYVRLCSMGVITDVRIF